MTANKECIFGTRPWKVFGEGPTAHTQQQSVGNFNESKAKPFTAEDIRFTTRDGAVYAIVLGRPTKDIKIKSLGTTAGLYEGSVGKVELLGSDQVLQWTRNADALTIQLPSGDLPTAAAVFKVAAK